MQDVNERLGGISGLHQGLRQHAGPVLAKAQAVHTRGGIARFPRRRHAAAELSGKRRGLDTDTGQVTDGLGDTLRGVPVVRVQVDDQASRRG